jgi:hypothetical protein
VTAVLEAEGLGKRYRGAWGLRDCDLKIPAGRVTAAGMASSPNTASDPWASTRPAQPASCRAASVPNWRSRWPSQSAPKSSSWMSRSRAWIPWLGGSSCRA